MEDRRKILVFDNAGEMTDFMAEQWTKLSMQAVREKGSFVVALSGGDTPRDFYRKLSGITEQSLWDRIHVFLADERFVPFADPDSNYGMLTGLLLDKVNMPLENRHPVPVDALSPDISANKYEKDMIMFFGLRNSLLPVFDLIVLGIGEDGHTASLFPGTDVLKERRHLACAVYMDSIQHNRITLTLPVINNAKNIIFLASGRKKADVIRKVLKEKLVSLPASMVMPVQGNVLFVLDNEAGSLNV